MDVFNPKILDASIRDVSSCLSDNQKVDLLLYAIKSLHFEGRSRTVVENAIQSCLQVTTLSPEVVAKARILRARARLANGSHFSAQEDLQAALDAEPDNPEAKALLHQRSVAVEKLLSPLPINKDRLSVEIWREIALFLPRRDLKSLLFVPHAISRIASQLLFRELDLHFGNLKYSNSEEDDDWRIHEAHVRASDAARHAQRSADILTRIIVDPAFAHCVRTLRIFASTRDGGLAFQTGMLTNALPKLVNLRNVHISSGAEGLSPVLRILQSTNPRLRGLSLQSPDYPADLAFLDFRHISHFTYTSPPVPTQTNSSTQACASLRDILSSNRTTLRTINVFTPSWTFPSHSISIRNLTRIHFSGTFPANQSVSSTSPPSAYIPSQAISELITHGRQLESLAIDCTLLENATLSAQFRTDPIPPIHPHPLPFLRHFAFTVRALGRRTVDKDLFPSITSFLRGRAQLQTLQLIVDTTPPSLGGVGGVISAANLEATGYDASIWGLLPSLGGLKAVRMTYPRDLAPGLAGWLIPRGVTALGMELGAQRLNAGMDDALGSTAGIGQDIVGFFKQLQPGLPPDLRFVFLNDIPVSTRIVHAVVEQAFPLVSVIRVGSWFWTVMRKQPGALSSGSGGGGGGSNEGVLELEPWPMRRVVYHAAEWLEWLGCEEAAAAALGTTREAEAEGVGVGIFK
ncbi:hypothetical protein P691DRAFT_737051 [Macrolepiota fuliginosa MF-IS2]|uniref:Uncharacterized protein n=1 Tax=Macrolepiota fuliginosa MF-IS2 TaxID=1400762 RepID=A0A9P5X4U9_9AGAR|nr:hypothetical protein P691DRAFT_737051 [Macrolepiota fuliginosa MF-IS2]